MYWSLVTSSPNKFKHIKLFRYEKNCCYGRSGFIGSHAVVELHEAGYEPIIVDDFSNSDPKVGWAGENYRKKPTCYSINCNDRAAMDDLFTKEGQVLVLFILRPLKPLANLFRSRYNISVTNIDSLLTLMEAMVKHQSPHLVFSSSCTVYGQPEKLPVNEQSPILPAASPYGVPSSCAKRLSGKPLR